MQSRKSKLLSSTMVPFVMMAGVAVVGMAVAPEVAAPPARAACNPCAVKKSNPCAAAACNPCAAANPCNPCAAANPCNPCAAGNPCNPCAAACNPCSPCAAGGGQASLKCAVPRLRTAALSNPCNPCAAAACNPCNPCAAAACNPCNPCATANPCSPCAAGSPCSPCNPCTAGEPAELTTAEAVAAYDCLIRDMRAAYAKSDDPNAISYVSFRRYSTQPYVSATHGGRYVQNFANDKARNYGLFENSGTFQPGAVLAKDSFQVKGNGQVTVGPLFVMEKMRAGFNAESDDWRYTMVMPNGSVFGTTKGKGARQVQFCIGCHQSVAPEQDNVLLLPEEYRSN